MRDAEPAILAPPEGAGPILVTQFRPGEVLARSVRHLWSVEWDVADGRVHEQEVLSHPIVHLTVEGSAVEGSAVEVYGVHTTRFVRRLTGRGRVLGVHFHPGGFSAVSRVPLATLANRSAPAAEVLGSWVRELAPVAAAASVADADAAVAAELVLARHVPPPSAGARFVDDAVALVAADRSLTRVGDLATLLGTTVHTLQRRFDQHLGVGPKWVLRRQRIYDTLDRLQTGQRVDWAALAAELGFADQAHLTHVFSELVGVSPAAYERRLVTTRRPPS